MFIEGLFRYVIKVLVIIGAMILFASLVDRITSLKELDVYLEQHPQPWVGLTVGAAGLGLVLLLFAWINYGMRAGRPMSEEQAEAFVNMGAGRAGMHRVFRGKASGIATPEGATTFRAVKAAFRNGTWLRDPVMRVYCVGALGLLFFMLGIFGYFVVIGPPAVQVMCAGALLYAFGRTAWGIWRA